MNTPTENTAGRRTRRAENALMPLGNLPGSILFASALESESKKRETGAHRRNAIRQVEQPAFLSKVGSEPSGPLGRIFSWFRTRVGVAATKQLRLTETVQLGEKRFVAIIHVDGRRFLIGGGTGGVNLLTQLDEPA
ncbi:MAG TPA: flagellar biosynthetic protein FliO [Terracidiphilus sp.]|jgi:hypothetical protein|nr:flagellar biosynthetic protein FliO [Terracidiphilus sp.]